ncbi:MAG TPA: (2Fe-2S)-binding protein [Burkholderiales bacterium]|jgi:carbon-monoxide dehydrogenase small subunit|nr:(2Fe-2S)-binding protein [Burkholderiales bacterium]
MTIVSMRVNGAPVSRETPDNTLLAVFLREGLGLTGTHIGCDTSQCGCCVVRIDGTSVKSCTTLAVQVQGCSVTTVEGLAQGNSGETLHPIQKAFTKMHALQCGYCTPGMMMSAVDLIEHHGKPLTEEDVRHGMEGNLCRCTGYHNIVRAIIAASEEMHAGSAGKQPETQAR